MKKNIINISLIALLTACTSVEVPLSSNSIPSAMNSASNVSETTDQFFEEGKVQTKTTAERIAQEAAAGAVVKTDTLQAAIKTEAQENYKVGDPYKIDGVWYFPYEDYFYSEVGQASWYGAEDDGNLTANGSIFDSSKFTAAHRTLPMPSVVKVTNIDNNKTIIVKVNDRGPFARDRIIDLSEAAAVELGFVKEGHANVKVEILPEESKKLKAQLSGEGVVPIPVQKEAIKTAPTVVASAAVINKADQIDEPKSLQGQAPVETPVQVFPAKNVASMDTVYEVDAVKSAAVVNSVPAVSYNHYVQIGAFSNDLNANAVVNRAKDAGFNVVFDKTSTGLNKIKVVGFGSKAEAKAMIPSIERKLGYRGLFAQ